MIKFVALMLGLAAACAVSIVFGYAYGEFDLVLTILDWVYESVPVISVSLALVCVFLADMTFAFFTSRGNFRSFGQEFFAFTLVFPALTVSLLLPDSIEEYGVLAGLHFSTYIFIFAVHLTIGMVLAKNVWEFGGRDVENAYFPSDYPSLYRTPWSEDIDVLRDLTYVVECFASDVSGEGKFELGRLIEKLEKSSYSSKGLILGNLKEARELFKNGEDRHAQITVVRASRIMWREMLPN